MEGVGGGVPRRNLSFKLSESAPALRISLGISLASVGSAILIRSSICRSSTSKPRGPLADEGDGDANIIAITTMNDVIVLEEKCMLMFVFILIVVVVFT